MLKDIIERMYNAGKLTDEQVVNAIDKGMIDTSEAGAILNAVVSPVMAEDKTTVAAYNVEPIPAPIMEVPDETV